MKNVGVIGLLTRLYVTCHEWEQAVWAFCKNPWRAFLSSAVHKPPASEARSWGDSSVTRRMSQFDFHISWIFTLDHLAKWCSVLFNLSHRTWRCVSWLSQSLGPWLSLFHDAVILMSTQSHTVLCLAINQSYIKSQCDLWLTHRNRQVSTFTLKMECKVDMTNI